MTGKTFIIAEMACSHEGDPALARVIIDGAGAAGADAVQFQIWQARHQIAPQHPDFAKILKLEIPQRDWASLADYVRERHPGMEIIACVYERFSVDFCEQIGIGAYKIHTSDLSNPYLVKYVARTGKRIDLSVGGSTLQEIQNAVGWIRETSDSPIYLMYGIQNFPTPPEAIHLNYMMKLRDLFELPVGYQDHSAGGSDAGFWLPAAAMGMGVDILEKHITHNRAKKGCDHQAALNPDEFVRFTAMVREIEAAKGCGSPRPFSADEEKYRKYAKKSIVAARDLAAGAAIADADLVFMRAEDMGLPPDQAERLIGRIVARDIPAYRLIREEDLQ